MEVGHIEWNEEVNDVINNIANCIDSLIVYLGMVGYPYQINFQQP